MANAPGHGRRSTSWWDTNVPNTSISPGFERWIGNEFQAQVAGRVFGVRVYASTIQNGGRLVVLRREQGLQEKRAIVMQNYTPAGPRWMQGWIHPTIKCAAGDFVEVWAFMLLSETSYYTSSAPPVGTANGGLLHVGGNYATHFYPLTDLTPVFISVAEGVDLLFQAN